MTEVIWLGFSPSEVRLKNSNAKRSEQSEHSQIDQTLMPKVVLKGQGYFVMWENYLPTNSIWDRLAKEIVTHKHDKMNILWMRSFWMNLLIWVNYETS